MLGRFMVPMNHGDDLCRKADGCSLTGGAAGRSEVYSGCSLQDSSCEVGQLPPELRSSNGMMHARLSGSNLCLWYVGAAAETTLSTPGRAYHNEVFPNGTTLVRIAADCADAM
jgi:hypothetical protein